MLQILLTDDVYNEKHGSFFRSHGEVASVRVPFNRIKFGRFNQEVVHSCGATEIDVRGVRGERKNQDYDQNCDLSSHSQEAHIFQEGQVLSDMG